MLFSRCYYSYQGTEEGLSTTMGYPRATLSLSGLRSLHSKRKSVASNNNNCTDNYDNGKNVMPRYGRGKLDSRDVIAASNRGYGGSVNRGLLPAPGQSGPKRLSVGSGYGCGAADYRSDVCVRGGGGKGRALKVAAAETGKRFNGGGNGPDGGGGGKEGKSDGRCSGLVMEKVTILKRGQRIGEVAGGASDGGARLWNGDGSGRCGADSVLRTERTGRSEVICLETLINGGSVARSVVDCSVGMREIANDAEFTGIVRQEKRQEIGDDEDDMKLHEIVDDDDDVKFRDTVAELRSDGIAEGAKKEAERTFLPKDDLVITSTEWLGPDPSVISQEVSGIVQPVSIGSGNKSLETIRADDETPRNSREFEGEVSCRDGTLVASGDDLKDEEEEARFPVFMSEKWAGPAYCESPSPRCLPLPKFSVRHKVRSNAMDSVDFVGLQMKNGNGYGSGFREEVPFLMPVYGSRSNSIHQAGVDASATQDLRRLLRLD